MPRRRGPVRGRKKLFESVFFPSSICRWEPSWASLQRPCLLPPILCSPISGSVFSTNCWCGKAELYVELLWTSLTQGVSLPWRTRVSLHGTGGGFRSSPNGNYAILFCYSLDLPSIWSWGRTERWYSLKIISHWSAPQWWSLPRWHTCASCSNFWSSTAIWSREGGSRGALLR